MQEPLSQDTATDFWRSLTRLVSRNRAFITIWFALFIAIIGIAMVSPLLPVFAREMGASGIWLGLAFSGFAMSQIPAMPVVGKLSDRFNKKVFIWVGLLIYALSAVGYFWSPGYRELVLFRIISGIGAAMVMPIAYSYIGELAPFGHEGRYMGLFNVAMISGFGVGPVLGGVIHDSLGTGAVFLSMAVLSLLGFIIILLFLPVKVSPAGLTDTEFNEPSSSFATILRNEAVRGVIALQMVFGMLWGTVLAFIGIWMVTTIGTGVVYVGIVLSIRSLTNGIAAYPFGWLADRANRIRLVTVGIGAVVIATFSIPWLASFGPLVVLFGVMGLFESMAMPPLNAITIEKGRSLGMGSVMGVFNMAISLGLVIGSMAGGVVETTLGIVSVFRFAALLGLAGIIVFNVFMRRDARLRNEPARVLIQEGLER